MSDIASPVSGLMDYGIVGAVLVVMIWLYAKALKSLEERSKEDRADKLELIKRVQVMETYQQNVLHPALERANETHLLCVEAFKNNSSVIADFKRYLSDEHDSRENRTIRDHA